MYARLLLLVLLPAAAWTQPASTPAPHHEKLHSTLWMQTSVEYRTCALQTYAAAREKLRAALADPRWTAALEQEAGFEKLPPAVVLDIDETVLDNSAFQARMIEQGKNWDTAAWNAWTAEASAPAIAGALEFTRGAQQLGVAVFYVTNRGKEEEAATRRNLERAGFPLRAGEDTVLMREERPGWGSDKGSRRRAIASRYRVLLLVGDDLNDFLSGVRGTPGERLALASKYDARWGTRWFLLPNPAYGSWEDALYGHDPSLPEIEKRRLKHRALRKR